MLALYIIAGLAALVWGLYYVLRGSLVGGCLACVLLGACFGYDFLHFKLGPIPLTLDRLALIPLIAAYVVQRRLGRIEAKPMVRLDLLVAALVGMLAISTFWGQAQPDLFGRGAAVLRLVGSFVVPGVIYWIVRQSPVGRKEVRMVQVTLACFGVYLGVTGLLEISRQWWAVFPPHIADPAVGLHFGRARGPMVHGVTFGLYLGIGLLAALVWLPRLGRRGQLLLATLLPLMLAGIYFSYTRSVWLGAGLGVMAVLGLILPRGWRPLVLGGMVTAGLLLSLTRMESLVSFQREQSAADTGKSVDLRGNIAYVSWLMFLDRPLLGAGFGQYPTAKVDYLADRSSSFNLEATRPYVHHNTFLSLLTETGLVGLGLYLAVLGSWGLTAWRLARNPHLSDWTRSQGVLMVGVLLVYALQALFHEVSYLPIANTVLFFLAGLTVSLHVAARQQEVALKQQC